MRKIYVILFILSCISAFAETWTYDFETSSGLDDTYTVKDVSWNGIQWQTYAVRKGSEGSDFRNGKYSARMYATNGRNAVSMPYMMMTEDKQDGIGQVRFSFRAYTMHNASQVAWIVQLSEDQGVTWRTVGTSFTPTENEATATVTINARTGRIRIVRKDYEAYEPALHSGAFNIDDISISDNGVELEKPDNPTDFDDIPFSGGEGTEADPYLISQPIDIVELAYLTNLETDFSGRYFAMTNDIDMQSVKNLLPIGNNFGSNGSELRAFSGHFDGKGYTLYNIYMEYSGPNYQGVALFGVTHGADIRNVNISKSSFRADATVAALAAVNVGSSFCNCHILDDVTVDCVKQSYAGGVCCAVFEEPSTISLCSSRATVYAEVTCAGGILGVNCIEGTRIERCANYGHICTDGSGGMYAGGILGYLEQGSISISDCVNAGKISAAENCAGIVALMNGATATTIRNSYNKGIVYTDIEDTYFSPVVIDEMRSEITFVNISNTYYCSDFSDYQPQDCTPRTLSQMQSDGFCDLLNCGNDNGVWHLTEGVNDGCPVPFGEGGGDSGVVSPSADKAVAGRVYNLMGQQTSPCTSGLLIINGKKIIK